MEIVRRIIESTNRETLTRPWRQQRTGATEMDWSNSIGPLKGVYRGRQEVLGFWRSFRDAWDSLDWDPEEVIDVDETRVIVVNHVRMRGRGSGMDIDAIGVQLWTIIDGKARSNKLYQSKADALEAAGLSE